jgi:Undecaprenyl-phosphate glucose phosphotransferase
MFGFDCCQFGRLEMRNNLACQETGGLGCFTRVVTLAAGLRYMSYRSTQYNTVGASDASTGPIAWARLSIGRLQGWLITIAATEFLFVAAAAYFGSVFYHRVVLLYWPDPQKYVSAAILIAALVLLVSVSFRHFVRIQTEPRHRFLWNGVGAVTLAFSFFLSMMFLLKTAEDYSRGAFLFQIASVGLAVLSVRTAWYSRLQTAIALGLIEARRAVLIGDPNRCSQLATRLSATGIRTVHSFQLVASDDAMATRKTLSEPIQACRILRPDDIVIATAENDPTVISTLADSLSELPVDVHIVPVESTLMASARLAEFGNVVTIRVCRRPLSIFDRIAKRTLDIVIAVAGLILFSPLLLMVSLAIKLDSRGPIFFRQTRHGYNNERIGVLKFRTMSVMEDGDNFRQVVQNDPRVTRFGRVLRRANLDELPQLFNVLSGKMSVVGPRPHATAHNKMFEQLILPFSRRHNVKPGITGWAQVNGCRGETETIEKMRRRVEYDLYYIDHWSFLFDMQIIIMTLFSKSVYLDGY